MSASPMVSAAYVTEMFRRANGSWPLTQPEQVQPCRCGLCERRRAKTHAVAGWTVTPPGVE